MGKGSGSSSAGRAVGNEKNPMISINKPGAGYNEYTHDHIPAQSARMLPDTAEGGVRFFVHKSPTGVGWVVSEFTTGASLITGKTRAEAIAAFREVMEKTRQGVFVRRDWKRDIKEYIRLNGRANRG